MDMNAPSMEPTLTGLISTLESLTSIAGGLAERAGCVAQQLRPVPTGSVATNANKPLTPQGLLPMAFSLTERISASLAGAAAELEEIERAIGGVAGQYNPAIAERERARGQVFGLGTPMPGNLR